MSIQAINAVFKRSSQKSGPLLVLLAIADFTNNEGDAWPSNATLARKARMSKRNVQRCVRILEKAGELQILPNQGRHGSNIYRVVLGTESNNGDAHVTGDADVVKRVSSASSKDDTIVAQSVTKPLKEPTPIVPIGDEVNFWVTVCLDCFKQPHRRLPGGVLHKLARDIPSLDKKHAESLRKFYKSEELNSKEPPYSSRRH